MNDVQMASFKIISAVGTAKSYYIEQFVFQKMESLRKLKKIWKKGKNHIKKDMKSTLN